MEESGIETPWVPENCRFCNAASEVRSSASPRSITSTRSRPCLSWVTVLPSNRLASTLATSDWVSPSWRSRAWSSATRTTRAGSFQSSEIACSRSLPDSTAARSRPASRSTAASGPEIRYCTGLPTGGPSSMYLAKNSTPIRVSE